MRKTNVNELLDKLVVEIKFNPEELMFICSDKSVYRMFHSQNCCEHVSIEDICGDLKDLLNSPILIAESRKSDSSSDIEVSEEKNDSEWEDDGYEGHEGTYTSIIDGGKILLSDEKHSDNECCQWTFYRIGTMKGTVTIRWCGTSNGYYSTDVSFFCSKGAEKSS